MSKEAQVEAAGQVEAISTIIVTSHLLHGRPKIILRHSLVE